MKSQAPSSEPLSNPRHEAFAREIASGRNATQAYTNIYSTDNRRVACTGGHRLMRQKAIAARVRAIQQAGAEGVAMDLREIHDFLTRVVRTPASRVGPSSDLCSRVKQTRDGTTDVWMPDKLACLRLSAKLQGFFDTARPARTARLARSLAQSDPNAQPATGAGFIMTEERRAILIAKTRAANLARSEQADQQPQVHENRAVAEKHPSEERNPGAASQSRTQPEPGAVGRDAKPETSSEDPRVRPQRPLRRAPINSGSFPFFGQNFQRPAQSGTRNHAEGILASGGLSISRCAPRVTPEISSPIVII